MFYVSAVRLQDMGEELFIQKNGHWIIPVMAARKIEFLHEDTRALGWFKVLAGRQDQRRQISTNPRFA